jgi:hypothetical protein
MDHYDFRISRGDAFMLGFVLSTALWAFFAYCIRLGF